jgi:sterol carrier protein 2
MSGIPVFNVNNNCSTGSTALNMIYNLIKGGTYDCGLALGFEKMERGSLTMKYGDRTNPLDLALLRNEELLPNQETNAPFAARLFGNAGL